MTTETLEKNEILTLSPEIGTIVEGEVVAVSKSTLYINIPPARTGIIFGREFNNAKEIIKNVAIGDSISAKVVETENEDGYIELSLKEARQALIWAEAEAAISEKRVFNMEIADANKGGIIVDWKGIEGFIPASQLKPEHYPKVVDGDKTKILQELKSLVGQTIPLTIITALPKENKLIFSEKDGSVSEERKEAVGKYSVGDDIECEVTGIVEFGVFLKLEEGLEGLVHISELDWGLVDNPNDLFAVGEKVPARIIEIKNGKISLSIKSLKKNPWDQEGIQDMKKGDIVKGVVIKFNRHGALVSVAEGVAGLVHKSLFESEDEMRKSLDLGKTYDFQITLFNPEEQRLTFMYMDAEKKA
ncbi:MAG: small subunit ribosomal protein S1 [Flavobacteriaceae bacterium]|jgi:small subunit ribosomal protein S1